MDKILDALREELKKNADEKTRLSSQRFFKEEIKVYGIKSAQVNKISKEIFKSIKSRSNKNEDKLFIFNLAENLWQSGYLEESFIVCNWVFGARKEFLPEDFKVFESWISKYISNWASCDAFCNHTVGEFIEMYPEFIAKLKVFAKSDNPWLRRAAAVSLIIPAKKGKFLDDIFEIAEILLLDAEDLVQKGYGWLLKVASQSQQKEVFDFVIKHKAIMPRTALRYAIEKMPKELKVQAMAK